MGFIVSGFEICGVLSIYPPHPSPLPQGGEGEREQIGGLSKAEFDRISQVGVSGTSNSVSPLSLWERVRVRALGTVQWSTNSGHLDRWF